MSLLEYVNVLQGTASSKRYSCGNTLPLMQLPFGMAAFAPQTRSDFGNWFFHPGDRCLEGIRLTHQPSPWIGDYGTLCIMPNNGVLYRSPDERQSGIKKEKCVWQPHYMRARLLRYHAELEAAPAKRGAAFKVCFDSGYKAGVAIYLPFGKTEVEVSRGKNMLFIKNNYAGHGNVPAGFNTYFAFHFKTKADFGLIKDISEENAALQILFNGADEIEFSVAVSYLGFGQAELNLRRELMGKTAEQIKDAAAAEWERMLSVFKKADIPPERRRLFYSCLYRTLLFPHCFYELDENGRPVHYSTALDKKCGGEMYVDNGMWDVFRTQYPFLAEFYPELYTEIVRSHIRYYGESGWLPKWLSPGECGVMPGTLIDGVIADAAVRGLLTREELSKAYEGMKKHALTEGEGNHGRQFTKIYAEKGYIPCDCCLKSANLTMDYSYGDYCISAVAEILGKSEEARLFKQRSYNYKNLFDGKAGFIRGRSSDGTFPTGFDPLNWGGEYCEGGAWQNGFFAVHDIKGLADLYGGREGLIKKLDELFSSPPDFKVGTYGAEIHEMTEMATADFGQFAVSNQPSFHLPFLYAAIGFPERCAEIVRLTAEEAFSAEEDGFPGDEDNGSMSAWYLWCCLGRYPLCPGSKNGTVSFKSIYRN